MRIAIIGAGLAGLAAARELAGAGLDAVLFDKGRAPGGRVGTRRSGGFAFDHGAQYLADDGGPLVLAAHAAGVQGWSAAGGLVGVPGMSALPRALSQGLRVEASRHVTGLVRDAAGWQLHHRDATALRPGAPPPAGPPDAAGPFDAVLCTLPAPQAAPMLRPVSPALADAAASVRFTACWTVLVAFAERIPVPDTLRDSGQGIGWAARDSAKPGRMAGQECWVIQADATWTARHLEDAADLVTAALLASFARLAGPLPGLLHAEAHRWRYAVAAAPLGRACLWDRGLGLGIAGDWCLGDRMQHAWASGTALARTVLGTQDGDDA